jgi:hypothetical protein
VPGHVGIDGNETDEQLTMQGSSHPLTGTWYIWKVCQQSDQGLDEQVTKDEEQWQAIHGQRQAMGFLIGPLLKEVENYST